MQPEIRRIIAVAAHRRRTGRWPLRLYSLGTGEAFDIRPDGDGFVEQSSMLGAALHGDRVVLAEGRGEIELRLIGDVGFEGVDHVSHEPFSGRAGGGASVTVYGPGEADFYQYAVIDDVRRI